MAASVCRYLGTACFVVLALTCSRADANETMGRLLWQGRLEAEPVALVSGSDSPDPNFCHRKCSGEVADRWDEPCETLRDKLEDEDELHDDEKISLKAALRMCDAGKQEHHNTCKWVCENDEL
eukprot:gnl/TRDRNA2_/TRDRNA2_188956_c0_seq1.p3 gnl/TRDRNA2_/TRDRNA2_188956_c0~~gnl/TRDRNA2_/TRDRNA2_188956_c0_seq1.p3  ORF type:complete len:123 (-),score=29.36 gnl/TRDRNA2_/TRDRNA2_188956_c0_seq1:336-704(-)